MKHHRILSQNIQMYWLEEILLIIVKSTAIMVLGPNIHYHSWTFFLLCSVHVSIIEYLHKALWSWEAASLALHKSEIMEHKYIYKARLTPYRHLLSQCYCVVKHTFYMADDLYTDAFYR